LTDTEYTDIPPGLFTKKKEKKIKPKLIADWKGKWYE